MRGYPALSATKALDILMQSRYETETDQRVLPSVLSWFDNFRDLPIPQEAWLQCQLALIEGFTNAVRHAHSGLPAETPIEIEVTATTQSLDIKIWDRGPGFDFKQMLTRKMQQSNYDAADGRGLSIMNRVADTVEYSRTADQRNCLYIQKCYDSA